MHLLAIQILAISSSLLAWLSISSSCFVLLHSCNRKVKAITPENSILIILWLVNTYILYKSFFLFLDTPASDVLTTSNIFEIVYNLATTLLGGYIVWNKYLSERFKHKFNLSFLNITSSPTAMSVIAKKVNELDEKKKNQILTLLKDPEIHKSKITLKMIAKDISIDPAVLSLFIKQELGISFSEYINSLRLDNAQSFLLDNEHEYKTMAEFSEIIGFQSIASFYRYFIQRYKLSPLKFKEQKKAGINKDKDS